MKVLTVARNKTMVLQTRPKFLIFVSPSVLATAWTFFETFFMKINRSRIMQLITLY